VVGVERAELLDALDGLFAWDGGCVSSGIHDEALRGRVLAVVRAMPPAEVGGLAVTLYGQPPYGDEDREGFDRWLQDQLSLRRTP
jgi:hypothetical protein